MAFNYDDFGRVLVNKSAGLVSGYAYTSTTETLGTIVADNYFDDLIDNKNILVIGDLIFIKGSDAQGLYKVTSVTTHVTLSNFLNETHVAAAADPAVTDDIADGYSIGSMWINETDDGIFICTDVTAGAAVWKEVTAT